MLIQNDGGIPKGRVNPVSSVPKKLTYYLSIYRKKELVLFIIYKNLHTILPKLK
jgi:hypothetical protein